MKVKINGYEIEGEIEDIKQLFNKKKQPYDYEHESENRFIKAKERHEEFKKENTKIKENTMDNKFNKTQINWTKEEEQFLKDNVGKITYREIGEKLNRSLNSVARKIQKMKDFGEIEHTKRTHSKEWSEEDMVFLKENMDKYYPSEIAKQLGRTTISIYNKIGIIRKEARNNGEYVKVKRKPHKTQHL